MADLQKIAPGGVPVVPAELHDTLRLAVERPEVANRVQIRMTVDGGQAAERYSFHFEASGAGIVSSRMSCRMTQRDEQASADRIDRQDFIGLIRGVDLNRLIEVYRPLVRIPPCSLVGRIEISDGRQRVTFLFMADPAQAARAGFQLPPEFVRLVDQIYGMSAKYMGVRGIEGVRP